MQQFLLTSSNQGSAAKASLGRVYVEDPDDWDVADKSYAWKTTPHPLFTLNTETGQLYSSGHVREGRSAYSKINCTTFSPHKLAFVNYVHLLTAFRIKNTCNIYFTFMRYVYTKLCTLLLNGGNTTNSKNNNNDNSNEYFSPRI